jgi:hypothetical protein
VALTVTRVADRDASFLRFVEQHDRSRANHHDRLRDAASDAVHHDVETGRRAAIGLRAAAGWVRVSEGAASPWADRLTSRAGSSMI